MEWAKAIGGIENEQSNGIETDHEGNIIWFSPMLILLNLRCRA
jgi:hypothetical protein